MAVASPTPSSEPQSAPKRYTTLCALSSSARICRRVIPSLRKMAKSVTRWLALTLLCARQPSTAMPTATGSADVAAMQPRAAK
jgi:hypothetical protein